MQVLQEVFSNFWFQTFFKLFLGFFLSGIIGLERSNWNKPAGFRTYSLVGISAVLIMMCGEYLNKLYNLSDPTRIPAQLLSGIGFIGAGTILRDGANVKGLTTASGLLAVTCIGMSIGAGFYLGGIVATIIVYVLLSYSYIFSDKLEHFSNLDVEILLDVPAKTILPLLKSVFEENNFTIKQLAQTKQEDGQGLKILLKYNNKSFTYTDVIMIISSIEHVIGVEEI